VLAIKVALGVVELLGLGLLVVLLRALDLPRRRVAVYAWNPLVLVEVWGSAHLDALVVTGVIAVALAVVKHRHAVAAAFLGLTVLVKLYPVILLPLLLRVTGVRTAVVFALVVALGYVTVLGSGLLALGSLPRYFDQEYFNPGLVRSLVDWPIVSILAVAGWIGWVVWWRRPSTFAEGALPLTAGSVVLGPNLFPWYVLWVVPFLAVTPSPMWTAFTGTVTFAYAFFLYQPWALPIWARLVEFAPLALGAGWGIFASLSARGGRASSQPSDTPRAADATIGDGPADTFRRDGSAWS
jgi:hypothetical protein